VTFTKVLTVYYRWIIPFVILFYPLSTTQQELLKQFLELFQEHTCVRNSSTTFTFLLPFRISSAFSLVCQPQRQDLFCPSILHFCKQKMTFFCLFKIAIQGVSLWHFHVYMYYNLTGILWYNHLGVWFGNTYHKCKCICTYIYIYFKKYIFEIFSGIQAYRYVHKLTRILFKSMLI
jgi:hypothetical protein